MLRWTKGKKDEAPTSRPVAEGTAKSVSPAPPAGGGRPVEAEPAPPVKKSLPELLLSQGKVTEVQLQTALAKQRETGAFLGEILIQDGVLDESSLITFLAKHCKIPHLSLLDYLIDQDIVSLIPKDVCLQYRLLPIDKLGQNLTVAMVNPLDSTALEKVRQCCPDLRIKPILCAYNHFEAVTEKIFSEEMKRGPVELSASSLGLKIPKKSPPPAPQAVTPVSAPVDEVEKGIPEAVTEAAEIAASGIDLERERLLQGVFREPREAEAVGAASGRENSLSAQAPLDGAAGVVQDMAAVMMDSMRDTYAMLARRMELFRELSPEDVAMLFARGMTVEYERGQIIFEKGQPGREMFVILGGAVEIYDGDRVIAILERGDMFGEMALVSREPRSASVRAAITTSLLALNNDLVKATMPPKVAVQLLTNIVVTLSARLRQANEQWLIRQQS